MDLASLTKKGTAFLKKHRYAVLILLIGLVLMALPANKDATEQPVQESQPDIVNEVSVSEQLADILSQIDGAGKVHVMLTIDAGEEILYQSDDNISVTGETSTTQTQTVIVTNAGKEEIGLVRQVNPPKYLGAIVVCQGADSPSVQLAIVDAVAKVTGLGADRISVLKMK